MINLPITSLTAAFLALIYVGLSLNVILYRRKNNISLGYGTHEILERKIRAHSNFIEYVPLALILMSLTELQSNLPNLLISLSLCLILGRICHIKGLLSPSLKIPFRVIGMVLTFSAIASFSVWLLIIQQS